MRLRAPAYPLITIDPYFNIWSHSDRLTDSDPVHWTDKPNTISGIATIDGVQYRVIGEMNKDTVPAMKQVSVDVSTFSTTYVFEEAEKGDKVSIDILKRNISEIARIIRASLSHFSEYKEKIPVILGGGLTNQKLLLPYLFEALSEDIEKCNIQILSVAPVHGALELAKSLWKGRNKDE